eukprot:sb/3471809/
MLLSLPDELLLVIARKLPGTSLHQLSHTSSHLYHLLCEEEELWRKACKRDYKLVPRNCAPARPFYVGILQRYNNIFLNRYRYDKMQVKVKLTRSGVILSACKAQMFCIGDANPDRIDWVRYPLFSVGWWRDGTVRTICRQEHNKRRDDSCNEPAIVRVNGRTVEIQCCRGKVVLRRN